MKRLLLCIFLICNSFVFAQSKKEMDGKYNVDDRIRIVNPRYHVLFILRLYHKFHSTDFVSFLSSVGLEVL